MTEPLEALKLYVEKDMERKRLEAEAKKLKAECDDIMELAMKFFEDNGVQNINILDRTAYIKKSAFAAFDNDGIDRETAISVLEDSGFSEYAKPSINWQALSAALREHEEIPAELEGTFRLSEKYTIGIRKG